MMTEESAVVTVQKLPLLLLRKKVCWNQKMETKMMKILALRNHAAAPQMREELSNADTASICALE